MSDEPSGTDDGGDFRARAEKAVAGSREPQAGADAPLSAAEAHRLIHELRVHQIELEMQNEQLRLTQLALEHSRERYFDLYDLAPVGYCTLDELGLVTEANLTAARVLGVPRAALINRPLTQLIFSEDQDTFYLYKKSLPPTGVQRACDLRMLKPTGGTIWVRLETTAARDARGARTLRVTLSDISEEKRSEAILKSSELRHRRFFERSRDALMTLAPPDWRFTSANAATLRMFGAQSEAQFVSLAPSSYSPPRQASGESSDVGFKSMIDRAMEQGFCSFPWTHHRLGGDDFPSTVLLTRLELEGEELLQSTVRDETERKKREIAFAQSDRLATMGMLASGISHEINNPLTYLLNAVETLSRDLPRLAGSAERCATELRRILGDSAFLDTFGADVDLLRPASLAELVGLGQEASRGTRRIHKLSRSLRIFGRTDKLRRTSVDLNHTIECAIDIAHAQVRYRAAIVRDFGKVQAIESAEGALAQVFLNLLMHGAFADEGGGASESHLMVRTWQEGTEVCAEIVDTGHATLPADLSQAFGLPFASGRAGEDKGLGLAISRSIVADLGGTLHAESSPERGSRFELRFNAQPAAEAPGKTREVERPRPTAFRGRVLLIDDEPALLGMMARILTREHEIVSLASGQEALTLLEHDRAFDIIICDVIMPELTGIDVHRWLSQRDPLAARRLVFITGGTFTQRAGEYLDGVENLRLEKPFEATRLKQLVAEHVRAARG